MHHLSAYIFGSLLFLFYVKISDSSKFHSKFMTDPRKNSSLFDVVVSGNPAYNAIVANCSDILYNKKSLNHSTLIFKYKLIYYSPMLSETMATHNSSKLLGFKSEPIFSIDINNGSLHIKTPNRPLLEYLCIKKEYCSCFACIFQLNIIYSTENKINADTIRVFIDDSNDYAPIFINKHQSHFSINISESSQIGDSFKLVNSTAIDSDAVYNQISYYLSDENIQADHEINKSVLFKYSNIFDVALSNESLLDLNIILKAHIDFEANKTYELYLIARDNGYPNMLQTSKRLIINILDENDHNPICEKSLFIANINENTAEQKFLRISATDADSGLNSKLEYYLAENDYKIQNFFEIEKSSGWLSLKMPLDFEKKSYYDLKIKVQDSGLKNVYKTYCSARINLIDLNDNPAKIKIVKYLNESISPGYYSLNTMSDTTSLQDYSLDHAENRNQIEIFENNQPGTVLALLRVFDFDSLSNYKFLIQSAAGGQEDLSMFQIRSSDKSSREFELFATVAFDAEILQSYRIKIILYDLQSIEPNTTLMVNSPTKFFSENNSNNFQIFSLEKIKILDLNDNGPKFIKNYYEFSVKENTFNVPLNQKHSIKAFDFDSSPNNSKLTYKILDKNNQTYNTASLHIYVNETLSNNNYPVLIVNQPFDYERNGKVFEFYLAAMDAQNLTDTALISIKISDLNDNYPMFMNENTTFFVKENMVPNSFIGQVIALDKDSQGPNSDVSFRILSKTLANIFKIYKSGVISNKIVLDRELQSFYPVQVEAYDSGNPSLTRTAYFYIQIEDENDNKPIFIHPNESTTHMFMFVKTFPIWVYNDTNKLKLIDLEAFDSDYDLNAKITYSIEDSSENLLEIDANNGSVYLNLVKWNENKTLKKMITSNFSAKDSGSPSHKTILNFTFFLNYEQNEIPEILNSINSNLNQPLSLNRRFVKIISSSYFLMSILCISFLLILTSGFILIYLARKTLNENNNQLTCDRSFHYLSCFYALNRFILKTKYRILKNFNLKSPSPAANKNSLTVKDISSNEIILNDLKTSSMYQIESQSVMNASIINNCSINEQNEADQCYGFVNNTYSFANHKTNSMVNGFKFENSNVKQLNNRLYMPDSSNPCSYNDSIKIANPVGSSEKIKQFSLKSETKNSSSHVSLPESTQNSSRILQNLLIKFEKFYADTKI